MNFYITPIKFVCGSNHAPVPLTNIVLSIQTNMTKITGCEQIITALKGANS